MRTETPCLLQTDIAASLEALNPPTPGGRYLVEVCWFEGGRIVGHSYQIRAASELQAAARARKRALATLGPGRASRLEVTDIERIWHE